MQRKLATWAATDPPRRVERLLRLITQPEWLAEAARITLASKGAHTPGVDGVNKTTLQARLAAELQILRDELLSGCYQPLPARRVYIPKSNGKQRPLGIPTLRDRIVQRAMLMAMELYGRVIFILCHMASGLNAASIMRSAHRLWGNTRALGN
ncbi:hypothetical protein ADT43_18250 (plasmid) [Yersinia pestis subsp. microtus bv. Ulegeica]|nr:hypothetical protein ADT43_18250 [Yersinia pestis subsp. microtus bv. Ulegeica]